MVREVFRVDRIVQVSGNKFLLFVELFTVNSLLFLEGKENIGTPKPLLKRSRKLRWDFNLSRTTHIRRTKSFGMLG